MIVALLLWKFINSASLGSGTHSTTTTQTLQTATPADAAPSSRSIAHKWQKDKRSNISAFVDKYPNCVE